MVGACVENVETVNLTVNRMTGGGGPEVVVDVPERGPGYISRLETTCAVVEVGASFVKAMAGCAGQALLARVPVAS